MRSSSAAVMTLRRMGEVHLLHGYRSGRSSSGRWPLEVVPLGVVPFRGILLGMGGQGLAVPLPPGHVHGSDSAESAAREIAIFFPGLS